MTHNDKDTELYDKAEELIEQKPTFAEGETYGEVTVSDTEESVEEMVPIAGDEEFNHAEGLIERKPEFGEGASYGEQPLSDVRPSPSSDRPASQNVASEVEKKPIFTDSEPPGESEPGDHDYERPQEHIGLLPLNRINHPLR